MRPSTKRCSVRSPSTLERGGRWYRHLRKKVELSRRVHAAQSPAWTPGLNSVGLLLLATTTWIAGARPLSAQRIEDKPAELEEVGITQHLDAEIPLQLSFTDSGGDKVKLGELFDGNRPVILTMNYSDCPMLCILQLNGLLSAMERMKWDLGEQYRVITISIDPLETPQRAQLTKQKYLKLYGRPGSAAGWHFLTSHKERDIQEVARTVGFRYKYLAETKQYAHVAVLMICTPQGRVSQYLFGIEYDPQTLRLSLVKAAQGKIGSAMDQILLYCFHYDPTSGRYGPAAFKLMRIGGVLTAVVLGGMLSVYWLREVRKAKSAPPGEAP